MNIEIEDNPNCSEVAMMVFQESESPRSIRGILTGSAGQEEECEVVGVVSDGSFAQAHTVKIADSGDGVAYLIYGGDWGIRLKPKAHAKDAWDLKNPHQWGEPYKVYGNETDILF